MSPNPKRWIEAGLLALVVGLAASAGGAAAAEPPRATSVDEKQWSAYMAGARLSVGHGYGAGAERQLLAALRRAKKFGADDPRLAETLRELGKVYGHEGELALTQALYGQWVALPDKAVAWSGEVKQSCFQNAVLSLQSYAALLQLAGRGAEAAEMEARAEQVCKRRKPSSEPRLTVAEITSKVKAAGYVDIRAVKFDQDRYEVSARNNNQQQVLLLVDPKSGAVRYERFVKSDRGGAELTMEQVVSKVQEAGFARVHLVARTNAVYEIHARDDKGQMVELYVHPRTGDLLRHPKTGTPLQKAVPEGMPFEPFLTVDELVAKARAAGYRKVVAVTQHQTVVGVHAHDAKGKPVEVYMDPKTGEVLSVDTSGFHH